jgi:MFS family permease
VTSAETTTAEPSIWRNRDFGLLLGGQVVSYVGNQLQNLAIPLVVLAISRSATQAGLTLGLNTVAYLLFGPLAGALADRWDRKTTMICCEVGRGLLTASIVAALSLGRLTLLQLYVVAFATGILATIFQTANTAAMPNVVSPEQLPTALGYTQSAFNAIRIIGASLAGLAYGLGRAVPFAANAVSFAVSAMTLRLMRNRFSEERVAAPRKLTAEIREGLTWAWRQPVVRFLTLIEAGDNIRFGAGYLVIILLAQRLGASALVIGAIFSGAAIGAVLGSLVSDRISRRYPLGRISILMLWLEACAFPLYALAPDPLLLGVVAAAESLVAPVYTVAMTTYCLSIVPDAMRGRITSATTTVTTGAISVGTIGGAALLTAIGPRPVVWLSTGWLLALALATTANRSVRTAPVAGAAGR